MTGAEQIAAERATHEERGYTAEHDANHIISLREAARAYIHHSIGLAYGVDLTAEECGWPWDEKYWHPADELRDLVRAGALVAADIDATELEDASA